MRVTECKRRWTVKRKATNHTAFIHHGWYQHDSILALLVLMYTCITLDVSYHGDCQSYNASKRSPEEIREISFCIEKIDQILFKLVLRKFSNFAAKRIPSSHLSI